MTQETLRSILTGTDATPPFIYNHRIGDGEKNANSKEVWKKNIAKTPKGKMGKVLTLHLLNSLLLPTPDKQTGGKIPHSGESKQESFGKIEGEISLENIAASQAGKNLSPCGSNSSRDTQQLPANEKRYNL